MASPRALIRRISRIAAYALAALSLLLWIQVVADNRFFAKVNHDIVADSHNREEQLLQTFDAVSAQGFKYDAQRIASPWARWLGNAEFNSPLHLSARSVLSAGSDHIGACGSLSRAMIVLLRDQGFEVRKAFLYGKNNLALHTVVEVMHDGEWRVFDPTYSWYWRRADGEIATVDDLATDSRLFNAVAAEVEGYPTDLYTYDRVHHLRWDKLSVLAKLRNWLSKKRGEDWVRNVQTPYLYERPRVTFAAAAGFGAVILWLLPLAFRRRSP